MRRQTGDTHGMTDVSAQALIADPAIESVEIKLTVRDDQEGLVYGALKRADADPERREVYFADDDELTLYEAGLVIRARKVDGDTDNSTVKLRPVTPDQLDERWKRLAEFTMEVDAVGSKFVCSAKIDTDQERGEIDAWVSGEREREKLLSEDQEALIAEHAPVSIEWAAIRPLGPIEVRKWEIRPKGLENDVAVEEWVLPDDSNLLELSIKVKPEDAEDAARRFRAYLSDHGIDLEGDQQTKTKAALYYFTGRT